MLTNSSSSSPATSLPHSASSDFSVDIFVVDTKNAPRFLLIFRYDGMIFEALSALADANGSDVGDPFSASLRLDKFLFAIHFKAVHYAYLRNVILILILL
ncbi:unnamed protein product [Brassica rapa subsp. narinosa]